MMVWCWVLWALVGTSLGAVEVHVDPTDAIAEVNDTFIGFGLEMFRYLSAVPLFQDPQFRYLTSHLAPGVLRVGGITADWVTYVNGTNTKKEPSAPYWPTNPKNLTWGDFEALVDYAHATNITLLFDLNELHGRNCHWENTSHCKGAWDMSNVAAFLTYIHDQKVNLYGFELGNELTRSDHITIEENIADHIALAGLVSKIWSDRPPPPIFGPSTDICNEDVRRFLEATRHVLSGFTFHSYPGESGVSLLKNLQDPRWLRQHILIDDRHANSSVCVELWKELGASVGMKLWITETDSAYRPVPMIQNGFLNGHWYIASLGQFAATGVGLHAHWSLIGEMGVINTTSAPYPPVPDYYVAVVHKQAVGGRSLGVRTNSDDLLVYAYCARGVAAGGVAVTYVNPGVSPVTVEVHGLADTTRRQEYFFTSYGPIATSTRSRLNGNLLALDHQGHLPPLLPHVVATADLVLPAQSHGVVVFPQAAAEACTK